MKRFLSLLVGLSLFVYADIGKLGSALQSLAPELWEEVGIEGDESGIYRELKRGADRITIAIVRGTLTNVGADVVVDPANKTRNIRGALSGVLWSSAKTRYKNKYKKDLVQEKGDVWRAGGLENMKLGQVALNMSDDVRIADASGKDMQVIHVVGPDCNSGENINMLSQVYVQALQVANDNDFKIIAFPAVSTGVFGCDIQRAGRFAIQATVDFLEKTSKINLKKIIFVVFSGDNKNTQKKYFDSYDKPLSKAFIGL